MDIAYIKNSTKSCMSLLENVYNALNTLSLTGYAQQKTNANCMEALQQVYEQLKNINKEVSKEDDKPEG